MRYLLMICHEEPTEPGARHVAWLREMTDRGMFVTGSMLRPVAAAVQVRQGEKLVSQEPLAEGVTGQFVLLDCADLQEAIAAAASHPGAARGRVEIRPLTDR